MKLKELLQIMDARLKVVIHTQEGAFLVQDDPTPVYFYLSDMESIKPIMCNGFYEATITKVFNDGYVHVFTDFDALA